MTIIDKLTIGKYQTIANIEDDNEVTKGLKIISTIEGLQIDEVRKWDIVDFKKYLNDYAAIDFSKFEKKRPKVLIIGGVRCKLIADPSKMSSGQFIDVCEAMKGEGNPVNYIHKVIAIMAKPEPTFADKVLKKVFRGQIKDDVFARAEQVKELPLKEVWGVFIFFLNLYWMYLKITEDYLEAEMNKTVKQVNNLLSRNGAGS